jgi:hypothetical protein
MMAGITNFQARVVAYGFWMRLLGITNAVFIVWIFGFARATGGDSLVALLWQEYGWIGRAAIAGLCANVPLFLAEVFLERIEFGEVALLHRNRIGTLRSFRYVDIQQMKLVAHQGLWLEFRDGRKLTIRAIFIDPYEAKKLIESRRREVNGQA